MDQSCQAYPGQLIQGGGGVSPDRKPSELENIVVSSANTVRCQAAVLAGFRQRIRVLRTSLLGPSKAEGVSDATEKNTGLVENGAMPRLLNAVDALNKEAGALAAELERLGI